MTPERWQQIRDLLHHALQLPAVERPGFLDRQCASDSTLRQELDELLAAENGLPSRFLESPALVQVAGLVQVAAQVTANPGFNVLASGTKLGPYVIEALLGAGGMGEVYRARDARLDRTVAVKVLPQVLSSDPLRRQRFEREARAISALNHPHICTLHDVGSQDGTDYLVMEYLDGETLAARLTKGRLPLDLTLRYASEIADALDAAHRRGIVHRDLKPGNIFLTTHGESKVLDFGLAKLEEPQVAPDTPAVGATSPMVLTTPGVAMGTVAYMSPEQARGEQLDGRTDIFSLGAVVYEMATGEKAFSGKTSALVFKAVLDETPKAPTELNPSLPKQVDQILERALEKDSNLRYQHAADMRADLERLKRDTESGRRSAAANLGTMAVAEATAARAAKLWKIAVPVAFVAVVVAGALNFRSRQQSKRLTEKDTIVLADFANSTDDLVFDDALKTGLSASLRQSPFLNVLSDGEVAKTLQQMTLPPSTRLTSQVIRELCQRAGSKAYLAGSIDSLGSEYVLALKAVNCQNGDVLAEEQATADSKEKVLDALGSATSRLRGELGESLTTVREFDVPLAEATTSSLEALKAYSLGEKALREKGPDALSSYQRAIELDPNFAIAYLAAGSVYAYLGEQERASPYYTRAFQLREHASERERLSIEATYYLSATGELDKAIRVCQQEVAAYPRDPRAYSDLAGAYAGDGLLEKAMETSRQVVRMTPDSLGAYEGMADLALDLGRFDEAQHIIADALSRKLDDLGLRSDLYALGFLRSDSNAMLQQQEWFAGNPQYETTGLQLASDTEAYVGHLAKAREITKRAIDSAIRADNKEAGAIWQAIAAQREAVYGNAQVARRVAAGGLRLAPNSQAAEAEAAFAFALAGHVAQARSLAQNLAARFPMHTQMQSIWLPAIRAQVLLDRKNPVAAVQELQPSPVEFGNIQFIINGSCLNNAYVRGEAYLAAGQGTAAAAEFQKILDHSGLVWNCWTGALARLGVARGNALQSRTLQGADSDAARVRALGAYKDFLVLWKNADPDIPLLKQAKAEYAKLQ
jgi:eukaryotic-like serine/threonine-protein kinase